MSNHSVENATLKSESGKEQPKKCGHKIEEIVILQECTKIFRRLYIWPKNDQTFEHRPYQLQLLIFVVLILILLLAACIDILYSYFLHVHYPPTNLLTDLADVVTIFNITCIIVLFLTRQKQVLQLAKDVSDFSKYPQPNNFDEANYKMNVISKSYTIYVSAGLITFMIIEFFKRGTCKQKNLTTDPKRMCGLIFPLVLPEFIHDFPYYPVVFVFQAWVAYSGFLAFSQIIVFICGIIEILNLHVKQLKEFLRDVFNNSEKKEQHEKLKYCVQYHNHIIRLTEQMNGVFNTISFYNTSFTGLLLAIVFFQFMLMPQLNTALHGGAWLICFYMQCFFGQRLMNESEEIPLCIYSTDWFTADVTLQKYLVLIIARGNRVLYVDAQGFGRIGMASFTQGLNSGYTLLTILYYLIIG